MWSFQVYFYTKISYRRTTNISICKSISIKLCVRSVQSLSSPITKHENSSTSNLLDFFYSVYNQQYKKSGEEPKWKGESCKIEKGLKSNICDEAALDLYDNVCWG